MKISAVINVDTRPQRDNIEGLFSGVCNKDFLVDGVINKAKFLEGFDKEIIVHIDEHIPVDNETLSQLREVADSVLIRKHTHEEKFNDNSYVRALQLASGEIVMHFDQDCAAFTNGQQPILDLIGLLEHCDYVSYPSHWTPNAVEDRTYDYKWCSTRFFMCKRETLDFPEITKCLKDYDYLYQTYPALVKNPWTEHILGLISKYKGKGVYYPPFDLPNYVIFSWGNYRSGMLAELNNMTYPELRGWLNSHPIRYPNDIHV